MNKRGKEPKEGPLWPGKTGGDRGEKEEKRRVEEVGREIGVETKGEIEVKLRAGKRMEGEAKNCPCPLIVHVSNKSAPQSRYKQGGKISSQVLCIGLQIQVTKMIRNCISG